MHKERIGITDNKITMLTKLCENNPGALRVLVEMSVNDAALDPDSAWGEYSTIIALDTHGIYSSDIWCLYKDICQQSPLRMRTLLRAVQLGLENASILRGETLSDERHAAILAKVQEELPAFGRV